MSESLLDRNLYAVLAIALVLFAGAIGITLAAVIRRFLTNRSDRRRDRCEALWTPILVGCMVEPATSGPKIRRRDRQFVVLRWSRMRDTVRGSAAENLVQAAYDLGIRVAAVRLAARRSISSRLIGINALGELADPWSWKLVRPHLDADDMTLSLSAAAAAIRMRQEEAIELILERLGTRTDWHPAAIGPAFSTVTEEIGLPAIERGLDGLSDGGAGALLQIFGASNSTWMRPVALTLLDRHEAPIVAEPAIRFLSTCRHPADLEPIRKFAFSAAPEVRAAVASAAGLLGSADDRAFLEVMLRDASRQVRMAAAFALTRLPFVDRAELDELTRELPPLSAETLRHALARSG